LVSLRGNIRSDAHYHGLFCRGTAVSVNSGRFDVPGSETISFHLSVVR